MDIQQDISPEDEALLAKGSQESGEPSQPQAEQAESGTKTPEVTDSAKEDISTPPEPKSRFASLATPAVRHLLKEHDLKIDDITGTGKDGRVLKEDVQTHMASAFSPSSHPTTPMATATQTETPVPLTPIQSAMFKTMTRSLQTPHFLYTDTFDLTTLTALRHRLSAHPSSPLKISSLAFIIKAVSLSLSQYPLLNAKLDASDPSRPRLLHRSHHNIGIAMDTPQGLLVPNIKNVASLSISEIATQLLQIAAAAKAGKLSPADLSGGTITVTNIGSIGGGVVAPVIVPGEVAILGVGKARSTPVFDETGAVARAEMCAFSWSADHRVVDGATLARCSEVVRGYLEGVERMVLDLR
jgi:2-oxoisovalerate dehydrogenase E2 component (dihydrolipoyl transacylase)